MPYFYQIWGCPSPNRLNQLPWIITSDYCHTEEKQDCISYTVQIQYFCRTIHCDSFIGNIRFRIRFRPVCNTESSCQVPLTESVISFNRKKPKPLTMLKVFYMIQKQRLKSSKISYHKKR
jgi:hypothetical protein